ncbi:MAG: hypothetical protein JNM93_02515 [Bacteriovoracaceae bacterium]|nr:hypothetical protein [Bacteriovoracaceae bacterium]
MNNFYSLHDNESQVCKVGNYFTPNELGQIPDGSVVIDFTGGDKNHKKSLLKNLSEKNCIIYSDLTCFNPEEFYAEFPKLYGVFSALLLTPKNKIELHWKNYSKDVETFFKESKLELVPIKTLSIGFIYPRILAQIINEAYFALAEKIATPEDIDRAMLFGVNYPQGPFAWSKGREAVIARLINELKLNTKNKRYDLCESLQSYL